MKEKLGQTRIWNIKVGYAFNNRVRNRKPGNSKREKLPGFFMFFYIQAQHISRGLIKGHGIGKYIN
jgi:hypothetical protein